MDGVTKANSSGCIAIILWSSAALLISYSQGVPPFLSAAIVSLISFLVTACIWFITKQNIAGIFKQKPACYLVGIGGMTLYRASYYTALKIAPIIESNLINYLWPLLLAVFSVFILKNKLSILHVSGLVTGFAGAALIIFSKGSGSFDTSHMIVYIPAFLAAVTWGLYSNLTRLVVFDHNFMGVVYLCSSLILFALHFVFEDSMTGSPTSLIPLVILGLFITYTFWDHAMKKGDVLMLASLSYMIPLFSTLLLIAFGRGEGSLMTLAAGVLIIAGSVIVNFDKVKPLFLRVVKVSR